MENVHLTTSWKMLLLPRMTGQRFGNWSLTATASSPKAEPAYILAVLTSTVMVGCVEGILGLRPDLEGLRIAPAIPKSWSSFELEKDFRGRHLHIRVENPEHRESGFTRLLLNGQELTDNYIPEKLLEPQNDILLTL